jgi:hypothetical protein
VYKLNTLDPLDKAGSVAAPAGVALLMPLRTTLNNVVEETDDVR